MGSIYTKIAGVTFKNDDGVSRQTILEDLNEGDFLDLKDDSSAKYPEAIGVYDQEGRKIGNLPKVAAESLREILGDADKLGECIVMVISVGSEDGKPLGCQIEISHDDIEDDMDEQYEREIQSLDAQIKSIDQEYKATSYDRNEPSNSTKSGMGVGCFIVLLIIGGTIGILLYRFFNGIK